MVKNTKSKEVYKTFLDQKKFKDVVAEIISAIKDGQFLNQFKDWFFCESFFKEDFDYFPQNFFKTEIVDELKIIQDNLEKLNYTQNTPLTEIEILSPDNYPMLYSLLRFFNDEDRLLSKVGIDVSGEVFDLRSNKPFVMEQHRGYDPSELFFNQVLIRLLAAKHNSKISWNINTKEFEFDCLDSVYSGIRRSIFTFLDQNISKDKLTVHLDTFDCKIRLNDLLYITGLIDETEYSENTKVQVLDRFNEMVSELLLDERLLLDVFDVPVGLLTENFLVAVTAQYSKSKYNNLNLGKLLETLNEDKMRSLFNKLSEFITDDSDDVSLVKLSNCYQKFVGTRDVVTSPKFSNSSVDSEKINLLVCEFLDKISSFTNKVIKSGKFTSYKDEGEVEITDWRFDANQIDLFEDFLVDVLSTDVLVDIYTRALLDLFSTSEKNKYLALTTNSGKHIVDLNIATSDKNKLKNNVAYFLGKDIPLFLLENKDNKQVQDLITKLKNVVPVIEYNDDSITTRPFLCKENIFSELCLTLKSLDTAMYVLESFNITPKFVIIRNGNNLGLSQKLLDSNLDADAIHFLQVFRRLGKISKLKGCQLILSLEGNQKLYQKILDADYSELIVKSSVNESKQEVLRSSDDRMKFTKVKYVVDYS